MTKRSVSLTWVSGRLEAGDSLLRAKAGDFSLLCARLRSKSSIPKIEREFLADLLEGKIDLRVKWVDARKKPKPLDDVRSLDLANHVKLLIDSGLSKNKAYRGALDALRPNSDERLATARKAYDRWYPNGRPIGMEDLSDLER